MRPESGFVAMAKWLNLDINTGRIFTHVNVGSRKVKFPKTHQSEFGSSAPTICFLTEMVDDEQIENLENWI